MCKYSYIFLGHSSRETTILWKWMEEVEERFLKVSCPEIGKDPKFLNGYMKNTPYDGSYLFLSYEFFTSSGLKHCNVLVQIGYGILLSNEVSSNLFSQVYKTARCATKDFKAPRGGLAPVLPSFCPSSSNQPNVVLVIPLQGRYKAMQRFMESYEKNFLHPHAAHRLGSPGATSVELVIVLLGGVNDELGLNDAASNLLKNYQNTYGTSLIRYHVAATGDRGFSRGAGKKTLLK